MKCDICNGSGRVVNPRYLNMSNAEAFERGIPTMKKCHICEGLGYVGIDLNAMKHTMLVIYNQATMSKSLKKELKYLLDQLADYPELKLMIDMNELTTKKK